MWTLRCKTFWSTVRKATKNTTQKKKKQQQPKTVRELIHRLETRGGTSWAGDTFSARGKKKLTYIKSGKRGREKEKPLLKYDMLYDNWSLLPLLGQRNRCQSRCASATTTFHSGAEKKGMKWNFHRNFSLCLSAGSAVHLHRWKAALRIKNTATLFALLLLVPHSKRGISVCAWFLNGQPLKSAGGFFLMTFISIYWISKCWVDSLLHEGDALLMRPIAKSICTFKYSWGGFPEQI